MSDYPCYGPTCPCCYHFQQPQNRGIGDTEIVGALRERDQLRAKLAEVTEDRDLWKQSEATCDRLYTKLDAEYRNLRAQLEAAEERAHDKGWEIATERDALRAALKRYGEHDGARSGAYDSDADDCPKAWGGAAAQPCTCGLDATLGEGWWVMSGICSAHQGREPGCVACAALDGVGVMDVLDVTNPDLHASCRAQLDKADRETHALSNIAEGLRAQLAEAEQRAVEFVNKLDCPEQERDDDYYWMDAAGVTWVSKAQDHGARGRCSGIPDCCVSHYLAGCRPTNDDWGYVACPACVSAGNRVEVRSCGEGCSCGQWATRVRVEDERDRLIDQLRAKLAAAEGRIAELEAFVNSNTTERDGVRYSKSVAFQGCAKHYDLGATAERTRIVAWLRTGSPGGRPLSVPGAHGNSMLTLATNIEQLAHIAHAESEKCRGCADGWHFDGLAHISPSNSDIGRTCTRNRKATP